MSASEVLGPRAVCVTSNLALRKTLRRTLNAGGSSVEFLDELPPEDSPAAAIVFIDKPCRESAPVPKLLQIISEGGNLVMLGDSLEDDEFISMLRNTTVDHVITDTEAPDEVELVVTSVKLLSDDIFGLEKYLAWGAKVHEIELKTYEEKRVALLTVAAYAKKVGARRPMVGKIESVTDELLMNALYDAPAARAGVVPTQHTDRVTEVANEHPDEPALMRYACDGRYLAVSVQDNYGELHKKAILDHLARARAERGAPRISTDATSSAGAGLGLYFILSSVTRFIANIERGRRTEVICLFDLKQTGRDSATCARSLHIFTR